MSMEMLFVYVLLAFVLIGIILEAEFVVGPRIARWTPILHRLTRHCEKRYPRWCDAGTTFYAFFDRDRFRM
ncbi:hypothetical protein GM415_07260 [Pseudodesulfovibrio cashew]|uniref:Uncharacterized protein n=1 Tax=Pseudodesulfovibrio cashew TaxID=2678688 RepID=A0A6I6JCV8_9BACT|nr:hypothetical protein [Pseudodesulfovibrio cashew]QGY39931.1 hypothetical protein GM415_07260 [Pseudodesulfovibrio cashew]